jgi:DeoR/GlpR family transcriptional regulator of sugar metabolism
MRTHGGALPPVSPTDALPYQHRELEQVDAKRRIARTAVREIGEDDVIFLDASTTCYHLARIFPDIRCTVLTHSEPVFRELSRRTNVELVSTGGLYDRRTSCFIGPLAEQMLTSLHLNIAFLGCKGLDFKRGYSDGSVRHMNLKRSVIGGADQVVVLADHTKIDASARYFFASLEDVDLVITDPGISPAHRDQMKRASIRFLVDAAG